MVKLSELYLKIDKNGQEFWVGDGTEKTRFILHKKKSMGNPQGPKYALYISEKPGQPKPVLDDDDGNK
jgi:hypothetical protein